MNIKRIFFIILILSLVSILLITAVSSYVNTNNGTSVFNSEGGIGEISNKDLLSVVAEEIVPLSIENMRKQNYPGSDLNIEQTLSAGSNYNRYVVSYISDEYKIYALLTVPKGEKPENGWPVIVFNHGYIPPAQYRTTEKYIAYTDAFARNGYIVLKSDYRGHGDSEGYPEGAYYSTAYTRDVLNAVSSIKKYPDADQNNIGMWGHSMGGHITLRSMVVTDDIKAGVIWAGVVASYEDMALNWSRSRPWRPSPEESSFRRTSRQDLIDKFGGFDVNKSFWSSISPINYVNDISGPVQIHHGTQDPEVPVLFSEKLNQALIDNEKTTELYIYEGDDHNISKNLNTALNRSIEHFDKYLKPNNDN
jgi:uncharacterized protein